MLQLNTDSPVLKFVDMWYVACMEKYVANNIPAESYCYLNGCFIIKIYDSCFLLIDIHILPLIYLAGFLMWRTLLLFHIYLLLWYFYCIHKQFSYVVIRHWYWPWVSKYSGLLWFILYGSWWFLIILLSFKLTFHRVYHSNIFNCMIFCHFYLSFMIQ